MFCRVYYRYSFHAGGFSILVYWEVSRKCLNLHPTVTIPVHKCSFNFEMGRMYSLRFYF